MPELRVQVKMVTGDQLAIAVETCKRLGLGTNIIEGKDVTFESHRVSPELAHQASPLSQSHSRKCISPVLAQASLEQRNTA